MIRHTKQIPPSPYRKRSNRLKRISMSHYDVISILSVVPALSDETAVRTRNGRKCFFPLMSTNVRSYLQHIMTSSLLRGTISSQSLYIHIRCGGFLWRSHSARRSKQSQLWLRWRKTLKKENQSELLSPSSSPFFKARTLTST